MPSKCDLSPCDKRSFLEGDDPKEFEEVTETRIVGVTKTGVIRKRSIKRKVTKEEKSKILGYGNYNEEYEKIRERLIGAKMVADSVEILRERLKMIKFMHEDCMDLVDKWEETRNKRMKRGRRLHLELLLFSIVLILIFMWLVIRWFIF